MSLASDAGVATVEYVIVLALLAVMASLALVAIGPPLLESFRFQRAWLLQGVP
jgi:Tfp pilus assembly protein FimT